MLCVLDIRLCSIGTIKALRIGQHASEEGRNLCGKVCGGQEVVDEGDEYAGVEQRKEYEHLAGPAR